ncbi:MAG: hypothetical protein EZS28_015646 [Streblomastix strix]|uniref:Uncharacterized protein n=1 Tax=Streblomastix strix TaxID=222440 RepID=A0A5J4W2Q5_9EUKA|nr:MAG: hypothetical protein EZS28_015646 [Streblomastix strix]
MNAKTQSSHTLNTAYTHTSIDTMDLSVLGLKMAPSTENAIRQMKSIGIQAINKQMDQNIQASISLDEQWTQTDKIQITQTENELEKEKEKEFAIRGGVRQGVSISLEHGNPPYLLDDAMAGVIQRDKREIKRLNDQIEELKEQLRENAQDILGQSINDDDDEDETKSKSLSLQTGQSDSLNDFSNYQDEYDQVEKEEERRERMKKKIQDQKDSINEMQIKIKKYQTQLLLNKQDMNTLKKEIGQLKEQRDIDNQDKGDNQYGIDEIIQLQQQIQIQQRDIRHLNERETELKEQIEKEREMWRNEEQEKEIIREKERREEQEEKETMTQDFLKNKQGFEQILKELVIRVETKQKEYEQYRKDVELREIHILEQEKEYQLMKDRERIDKDLRLWLLNFKG